MPVWVSRKAILSEFGLNRYRLELLADEGAVKTLRLPWWRTALYRHADVARLMTDTDRQRQGMPKTS